MNTFKKVVILDSVILYPEHRDLLNKMAEEVFEYPTSLPEQLEKQYNEQPELFLNKRCYTQIAADSTPLQLLMSRIEGADVVISCWTNIPDQILELNPQLKLIVFWTHEKEHRINMALAKKLGITVVNIPDYGTDAVTEVVFAGLSEVLAKNYSQKENVLNSETLGLKITHKTFDHFRLLKNNEKYTRAGKFTHHFHKLGKIKFDFADSNIENLIPEQLVAHKRIGLLNLLDNKISTTLNAFNISVDTHELTNNQSANYYKFLAENDLIFYNAKSVSPTEIQRIKIMFPQKLIDVNDLPSIDYKLEGKIFGIVGLGRIGIEVARFAKKLGLKVQYFSRTRKYELETELNITYCSLETLLATSDIVSLHVTAHSADNLINEDKINLMKKGTIFINTADGNAIDQHTLTKRMIKNEILTYLDVYPGLPRKDVFGLPMQNKTDWKLHQNLPNHVLAYRAGWKTQESIKIKTYKLLGEMLLFLLK